MIAIDIAIIVSVVVGAMVLGILVRATRNGIHFNPPWDGKNRPPPPSALKIKRP